MAMRSITNITTYPRAFGRWYNRGDDKAPFDPCPAFIRPARPGAIPRALGDWHGKKRAGSMAPRGGVPGFSENN